MPTIAAVNNSSTDAAVRATLTPGAAMYSLPHGTTTTFTCNDVEYAEIKAQLDGLVTSLTPNFTYTVPGAADADAFQKVTLQVNAPASFVGSSTNGAAKAINIGAVLPANARIIGCEITGNTQFTGGGATTVTLSVGGTVATDIVNAADVLGGGTGARHGTFGPNPNGNLGGQQLKATFTPDASHNLQALTAGACLITVMYTVLP